MAPTLQNIVDFACYYDWVNKKFQDWDFCNEMWPDHTKDEDDTDLVGKKYNYVYHRYNTMFVNRPASFFESTRNMTHGLFVRYAKETGNTIPLSNMKSCHCVVQYLEANVPRFEKCSMSILASIPKAIKAVSEYRNNPRYQHYVSDWDYNEVQDDNNNDKSEQKE